MPWYISNEGKSDGPFDDRDIIRAIQKGLNPNVKICAVGSKEWTSLARHPQFADALRAAAPPPPPVPRLVRAAQDMGQPPPAPVPEASKPTGAQQIIGGLLVSGLMVLFLGGLLTHAMGGFKCTSTASPAEVTPTPTKTVAPSCFRGDRCWTKSGDRSLFYATKQDFDDSITALVKGGRPAWDRFVDRNGFMIEPNTPVDVLDRSGDGIYVTFLDGPKRGGRGWFPVVSIVPGRPTQ